MDCKNLVSGQRNICYASQNPQLCLIFDLYKASVNLSVYGGFKLSKLRKKAKKKWCFLLCHLGHKNVKNIYGFVPLTLKVKVIMSNIHYVHTESLLSTWKQNW